MPGSVFCDWLSIYQVHYGEVPVVNQGRVFAVDQEGVVEWDVAQKLVHRGSHDTSIRIRSDGNRVSLDGNIGRFDRPDNLFGYSVADCIKIANRLLALFNLPPFTDAAPVALMSRKRGWSAGGGVSGGGASFARAGDFGHPMNADGKDYFSSTSDAGFMAMGAVITRIDLTKNWVTGSAGNCEQFIRYLQSFKSGRQEPTAYKTTGVAWGVGSKYWYAKVYDKAAEYFRQYGKKSKKFDHDLFAFMLDAGIARHEIELKSRYLKQNNLWRLSLWVDGMEDRIYALFNDVVGASANVDSFLEIPGRAGELAVAWRDGADLKKRLAQNTYYRYRRELLKYGIDIAVPSNVTRLHSRVAVEVVTLTPCEIPAWYSLPKVA